MANRQQKRQPPRSTTNIVVRNGTAATQARASSSAAGNRRKRNKARRQAQVNVRVLPTQNQGRRRFPRRQGVGGRVVFQKINTTLGTVGSNESGEIECELTCLMNPATMKEATGSNSFGPLGIYASTYTLYKMTRCVVTLKPIVGDSAVAGTVTRVSWNPTSSPTQTSWSALGARKHVDVTPGKTGRFVLTGRDLVGPKGGWFKTNTKGDPMMCFAGTLECHTFGKTTSTYRNEPFKGGLFLAELETTWQFKDYGQQPGMLSLIKGEDTQNARIETGEGDKLQLVLPRNSRMARAATTTPSEIIWVVTDTIIQAGTALIPPPFGWLIRGGWWLVKRAAGAPVRTNDNEIRFDIYASISDARSNTPCLLQQPIDTPVQVGGLHFQQVTPGNTGVGTDIPMSRAIDYQPQGTPTQCIITSALRLKLGDNADNTDNTLIPSFSTWYSNLDYQNFTEGIGFKYTDRNIATYNLYKVTVLAGGAPANISQFENTVPIYLFYGSTSEQIGRAVAARYDVADSTPVLRVSSVLVYAEKDQSYNYMKHWRATTVTYPVEHQGNKYSAVVSVPQNTAHKAVRVRFEAGQWYLIQYVTLGVINHEYKVGDVTIASNSAVNIPRGDTHFIPTQATAQSALLPSTIAGTLLRVFTTSEVREDRSIVAYDLRPSFGCDDCFEFPPPPSEEDLADDEEEFEDPEEDEDEELELGPDDDYSDPPMSRLVVVPEAQQLYEQLRAKFSEREARLAVNQLNPSGEYVEFTSMYHNALVDGLSPRAARAFALGL
ncbi:MAG: ORF2 [Sichuan mamastrovirus 8]|nr:MAG: ORF2 [Sichuan mamastrovirus 8]